jgi:predicted hydrocarbon binding protein
MALKLPSRPPKILEKAIRFNAMQWKDGKFLLWNVPGMLSQLYVVAYQQRLMENQFGPKKTASILYNAGELQGQQGTKIITEKFGYAKTIMDKRKLFEFNVGQGEIVGMGAFKVAIFDTDKNIFIITGDSTLAIEYSKFFGQQKEPIDHFLRGVMAGLMEVLIDKKMFCYETKCIAKGNTICEFIIKPMEMINKEDPTIREQLIEELPDMKGLGAKKEPYLSITQS